jgi:hypothetical protein
VNYSVIYINILVTGDARMRIVRRRIEVRRLRGPGGRTNRGYAPYVAKGKTWATY